MFMNILDEDDIMLLTSFYQNCEKLNRELLNIQNIKNVGFTEKAKQIQVLKISILEKIHFSDNDIAQNSTDEYNKLLSNFQTTLHAPGDYWFESYVPMNDFNVVINSTQLVLSTSTGEKLKKIIQS